MTYTPLPTYNEAAPSDIEQQAVELKETAGSKKPNSDASPSQSSSLEAESTDGNLDQETTEASPSTSPNHQEPFKSIPDIFVSGLAQSIVLFFVGALFEVLLPGDDTTQSTSPTPSDTSSTEIDAPSAPQGHSLKVKLAISGAISGVIIAGILHWGALNRLKKNTQPSDMHLFNLSMQYLLAAIVFNTVIGAFLGVTFWVALVSPLVGSFIVFIGGLYWDWVKST